MIEAPPMIRVIGAVLIGVWLFAGLVAVLGAWRKLPAMPHPLLGSSERPAKAVSRPKEILSSEVFNLTALPFWWVDRDLRLAGANNAYARAIGYSTASGSVRDNAETSPISRALAADARATDRAVVGEAPATIENELRLLKAITIPLQSGHVAQLALDKTRGHTADSDADALVRAFSEVLDDLTSAVALFTPEKVLRYYNTAFAEMFLLNRNWLDDGPNFGSLLDAIHATGRLPEERDFSKWRAERRAWLNSSQDRVDERWLLPGGQILRVSFISRGGNGPLLVIEDQTVRVQLMASRDQLLAVQSVMLDHLREGVAVFGPDGKLKLFNRRFAEIVIASPDALAAAPQADKLMDHLAGLLNEPERAQGLRSLIIGATAGREASGGRITSTLGFTIEYSGVPLPDGDALLIASVIEPTTF